MSTSGLQLKENAELKTERIITKAIADKGAVSVRLNAQIQDTEKGSYIGLSGYSIVFKVASREAVDQAFDAIEKALRDLAGNRSKGAQS
jgi:hypothetical protein